MLDTPAVLSVRFCHLACIHQGMQSSVEHKTTFTKILIWTAIQIQQFRVYVPVSVCVYVCVCGSGTMREVPLILLPCCRYRSSAESEYRMPNAKCLATLSTILLESDVRGFRCDVSGRLRSTD